MGFFGSRWYVCMKCSVRWQDDAGLFGPQVSRCKQCGKLRKALSSEAEDIFIPDYERD
jgi:hypothetical protein